LRRRLRAPWVGRALDGGGAAAKHRPGRELEHQDQSETLPHRSCQFMPSSVAARPENRRAIEMYPLKPGRDGKRQRSVKKIRALRLHIVRRVVELLDPTASPGSSDFSEREDKP